MLFFQRRWNTSPILIRGNEDLDYPSSLTGTLYAKWSQFDLAGQGELPQRRGDPALGGIVHGVNGSGRTGGARVLQNRDPGIVEQAGKVAQDPAVEAGRQQLLVLLPLCG